MLVGALLLLNSWERAGNVGAVLVGPLLPLDSWGRAADVGAVPKGLLTSPPCHAWAACSAPVETWTMGGTGLKTPTPNRRVQGGLCAARQDHAQPHLHPRAQLRAAQGGWRWVGRLVCQHCSLGWTACVDGVCCARWVVHCARRVGARASIAAWVWHLALTHASIAAQGRAPQPSMRFADRCRLWAANPGRCWATT